MAGLWSVHVGGALADVGSPNADGSWRARIVAPTIVHDRPGGASKVRARISPVAPWNGGSLYLMVLSVAHDATDRTWLRVELPSRPNQASGWVPAAAVEVSRVHWRVVIDRAARTADAYRDDVLQRSWSVVVGKPSTPTPTGLFALLEIVRSPARSELGPWVLHLTAHSDALFDYGGGPGRVAMHGRDGPLLADPLGSASSHGCIRMSDDVIDWLAHRITPGTPVRIE